MTLIMEQAEDWTSESFWMPNCIDFETSQGVYHADWRSHLNEKNKEEVDRLLSLPHNRQRFVFYSRRIAKFFMLSVQVLVMPPEVTFFAVDLFDRFWVNVLCDSSLKQNRWAEPTKDVPALKKEGCLISLSCLQLASKLCCSSRVLPVSVVVEWMKSFGFDVSKKAVMTSELDVLRVVRWNLPSVTVLSYVEMFMEEMTAFLAGVRRSELLQVCVKIINITLIFHKEIFTKLHIAFKNRELRTLREKTLYLSVEGDSIRLAASVVCAGAMLYDASSQLADDMISHLASTTSYQPVEIKVLSQIITHIILRGRDMTSG